MTSKRVTPLTGLYIVYANLVMFLILYPWSALFTILVLTTALLRLKPAVRFFLWTWANGVFAFLGHRVHVSGKEHIEPGKNYLVVMNHTSMFDFPAIMALFPRIAWLGRENLRKIPIFGWTLEKIDYIVIYPGDLERSKQSIETAIAHAGKLNIGIFPEGTRTLDSKLKDFKKGFTYIVEATDIDILPVTINGLFDWKKKTDFFMKPFAPLHLVVGKPVENAYLGTMDRETMARFMKQRIEEGLIKEQPGE